MIIYIGNPKHVKQALLRAMDREESEFFRKQLNDVINEIDFMEGGGRGTALSTSDKRS